MKTGWLLLGPPSTPLVPVPGLSGCCALPLLVRKAGEPGAGLMSVKLPLRTVTAVVAPAHSRLSKFWANYHAPRQRCRKNSIGQSIIYAITRRSASAMAQ